MAAALVHSCGFTIHLHEADLKCVCTYIHTVYISTCVYGVVKALERCTIHVLTRGY